MKHNSHKQSQKLAIHNRSYSRRDFISTSLKAGTAALTTSLIPSIQATSETPFNVLFIIVDDLRPLLGCYGHSEMHTPNIDKLAQRGTVFNRAYCQFPLCNPSRASLLTGLRPETIGVLDNFTHYRRTVPDVVSLPQYFKANGYHTRSIGKIMHGPFVDNLSWSIPIWVPRNRLDIDKTSWNSLDVTDDELRDGMVATHTIDVLEQVRDRQFFLAVGFYKPHLPFNAPTKYYDIYDSPIIENIPDVILDPQHEMRVYADIPSEGGELSKEKSLELIRGYAASTSYMDAQVGRILKQLDVLGLTEKTVIIFCGDHGFHLGENGTFAKRTPYEVSVRSPLIVSFPGQHPIDVKTEAIVELVDIYPTLCNLCQLPLPNGLEGISLLPVIEVPTCPWKTAAFSQVDVGHAFSIHTQQYRYTGTGRNDSTPRSLYDHNVDPDEYVNIVNLPEYEEIVASLRQRFQDGWQGALPTILKQSNISQTLPWDINKDGLVNIQDMILVSKYFGSKSSEYLNADINQDGNINILDLLIVAAHFGESTTYNTPSLLNILPEHITMIEDWSNKAQTVEDTNDVIRKGIATLDTLINVTKPRKNRVLPNYPNPFNPETWIPYDLAENSDVNIYIHNLKGESIRHLKVGLKSPGKYRSRSRAAYWDGCNSYGEPVASGAYFYTFHTQQTKSTRKMVITK
ncbi:sulfatase-like hydrolase/transferase [Candidatus Poribacteria bacterium]|nr:sulfatase-like hydrolase/transferase [Candidatus Poribacteria bacterium]MYF54467.1 sulfatase-like hydrolase/transferase [Candidatus Poribacteria bacterium]